MSGETKDVATHALVFELEYVAARKRKVEFDALKSAMAKKNVELTLVLFAKSGMPPTPRVAVRKTLEAVGKSADAIEKAVAEVEKASNEYCATGAVPDAGLEKLVAATRERGIPVLAVTALPEEKARELMDRLGLAEMGVELLVPDEVKESFPRADDWLKMLKKIGRESATIVAVVSSRVACRGALTAGAACVVVPDEFTEHQDFGGAKLVLDSLSEMEPDEILDLTLRM